MLHAHSELYTATGDRSKNCSQEMLN